MKCYKNNIPRFHPYCKTIYLFCHSKDFNAVHTIGLISKTVFTNARKWSQDSKLISHTNRNLSANSAYPSFFLNALKISYIFYTYFNVMSTVNYQKVVEDDHCLLDEFSVGTITSFFSL